MSSIFKRRFYAEKSCKTSILRGLPLFLCFFPILFFSCIGASSQITLNNDGSGTIIQEYRISLEMENMGKLDGNEAEPPLPAGKADIERTVARVPGLRLLSYSSRQDGKDMVYRAEMGFASPEALEGFMEADNLQFMVDLPGKRIIIGLSAAETADNSFMELLSGAFEGYEFSVSLSVPGTAKAALLDDKGNSLPHYPGTCSVQGKTVEYTVPMADIVSLDSPLNLEISW